MDGKDRRQELQAILAEAEGYRRQMEAVRNEAHLLDSTMEEIRSSIMALDALKEDKEGTEILVSIGSGSFIRAQLKDTDKVIVGVGAGISLEKNTDEAKKILEDRIEEVTKAMEKMQNSAAEINGRLTELDESYRQLLGEVQAEQK